MILSQSNLTIEHVHDHEHSSQDEIISSPDAAWILGNSFRILTMQSGFSLLEAGHVSSKNIANIMVKNMMDVCFGGITYWAFGYGLSFGNYSAPFFSFGNFFAEAPDDVSMGKFYAHYVFQFSFATASTTIVSGAVAERMKLSAYLLFSMLNTFVYCLPAAWVWARNGFLNQMGFHDFAGASVVHLSGGASALVAAAFLGPRKGRFAKGGQQRYSMASPVTCLTGTFMLWWAWLSFSCGSTYGVDGNGWNLAAKVGVNTMNGSIGGCIMGVIISLIRTRGKYYEISDLINGVLGGLVSVTAGAAVFSPKLCFVIGAIGSVCASLTIPLLVKLRVDDPVGAVPVHFSAAVVALTTVGLFGQNTFGRLKGSLSVMHGGRFALLGVQLLGILSITVWSAVSTIIVFSIINLTIGCRVSPDHERVGADLVEHNIAQTTFAARMERVFHDAIKRRFARRNSEECLQQMVERMIDLEARDERGFLHMPRHHTNVPLMKTSHSIGCELMNNGIHGYFFACGFDLGMMMGGGAGRELAKWVLRGRPEMHLYGWDIRRFNPKVTIGNPTWLRERTHERFATMYKAVYPHDEPLAGRNQKLTPFHSELAAAGCVFQERHGWERAGWFKPNAGNIIPRAYQWYGAEGPKEPDAYEDAIEMDYTFDFPPQFNTLADDCRACRDNVVAFDMSYFGKFYLSGPDAQAAADWVFSNDVRKAPGTSVYTCMLNEFGGVEADLACTVIPSGSGSSVCDPTFPNGTIGYYITAGGGSAYHDWVHILDTCRHKGYNVTLTDKTEDLGILSVQGPKSRKLLAELAPGTDFSNAAFPFATTQIAEVAGHKCRMIRLSFVGELGYELHVPKESCIAVYRAVKHLGQEKYGFRDAGYRALEPLAAEKGFRFWDSDLRLSDTPLEAALGFTCKLSTDIDFLGRKAVEKQKKEGIKTRIVCLTLDDQVALYGLETIFRDDVAVGYIRRGEYAYTLKKPIGFGYISRPDKHRITLDWIRSGSYELERFGDRHKATIYAGSPFDPKHKRLQGIYE